MEAISKIRIYYPWNPFPATEGASHVVADQILALGELSKSEGLEVELVTWAINSDRGQGSLPEGVRHTTIAGPQTPTAAWKRVFRVASSLISPLASPELFHYPKELLRSWDQLGPADIAIYHYSFAYTWLCDPKAGPQESRRIVYFHNLESDLARLRASALGLVHHLNAWKLSRHEKALARLVDETWFLSPKDQEKLQGRLVVPGFPKVQADRVRAMRTQRGSNSTNPVLTYVGALDFKPNRQGLEWILDYLLPELGEGFQGEVRVIGRGADKALIAKMQAYPQIRHLGFVEDFDAALAETDWMLVPHVGGSGIRIKLLQALACGVPSIAHPEAASRLHPDLQKDPLLKVATTPQEWAAALKDLPGQALLLPFPPCLDSVKTYKGFIHEWKHPQKLSQKL